MSIPAAEHIAAVWTPFPGEEQGIWSYEPGEETQAVAALVCEWLSVSNFVDDASFVEAQGDLVKAQEKKAGGLVVGGGNSVWVFATGDHVEGGVPMMLIEQALPAPPRLAAALPITIGLLVLEKYRVLYPHISNSEYAAESFDISTDNTLGDYYDDKVAYLHACEFFEAMSGHKLPE